MTNSYSRQFTLEKIKRKNQIKIIKVRLIIGLFYAVMYSLFINIF